MFLFVKGLLLYYIIAKFCFKIIQVLAMFSQKIIFFKYLMLTFFIPYFYFQTYFINNTIILLIYLLNLLIPHAI